MALDEETKGYIEPTNSETIITGIKGFTTTLGKFTLKLTNTSGEMIELGICWWSNFSFETFNCLFSHFELKKKLNVKNM